jgi:hypothetical protein
MLGRRMHIIDAQRHDFPAPDVDASPDGARQLSRNVGFGIGEAPLESAFAGAFAKREYVGMTVIDDQAGTRSCAPTKALVETVEP